MTPTRRPHRIRSTPRRALLVVVTALVTVVATSSTAGASSAPSAPPAVTVVPLPTLGATGSLRIGFGAAAANGSPVTGYAATCTSPNGGVSGSASGPSAPIDVTGLTTGRRYVCTVTATNGIGTGPD